jgi:NADPH:quinone reductase-like Zn-dependent oxidoreductase
MKAAAIDRFGGPEVMHTELLPTPKPSQREVLIEVKCAGVGVWEPSLMRGEWGDGQAGFPRVLGSDGSGVVVEIGDKVKGLKPGDRVYGYGIDSQKGGFFAEFVALSEDKVTKIPGSLTFDQAGALAIDGITGLVGLAELKVQEGGSIIIIGASGGIGHLAVQLARRMGLHVLAVVSGSDGMSLCRRLGCDAVVDGKRDDVEKAAREFRPDGYAGALVLAGREDRWQGVLELVNRRGRIVYPNGVEPEPKAPSGVKVKAYDGIVTPKMFERLNALIEKDAGVPFHVEVSRSFPLEQAAVAMKEVEQHHVGKIELRVAD